LTQLRNARYSAENPQGRGGANLPAWTFITNHGAVLALVAHHGRITSREIAATLGITERSVLRIIKDLEEGGYLERYRDGRHNYYTVDAELPLRRDDARHVAIGELLTLLVPIASGSKPS
jgi:DNA-binding transcriptional ArsR family regulator